MRVIKREKVRAFILVFPVLFLLFLLVMIMSLPVSASSLTVKKIASPLNINAGEAVNISLQINNPFRQAVKIQVKDDNVVGGNGYNVQCLERTIPPSKKSVLVYEPVVAYSPGKFTLGKAKVSYTNPDTGKEEEAESNAIKVNVKGPASGNAKGVTTIYECNGMSMRSTSFSTSGMQQGSQTRQSQQNARRKSIQSRQMSNQKSVDSEALKKQMESDMRNKAENNKKFESSLAKNPELQKELSKLASQHYNLTSKSINSLNSTSGSFSLTLNNGSSGVKLNGNVANNKITSMNKSIDSPGMQSEMIKKASRNPLFRKYANRLKSGGFKQAEPSFQTTQITYPVSNSTAIKSLMKVPFVNPLTNQTANITVRFNNLNITSLRLQQEKHRSFFPYLFFLLLASAVVVYALYRRRLAAKEPENPVIKKVKKRDLLKEASAIIKKAELVKANEGKEFALLISEALRLLSYFLLDIREEKDVTQLPQLIGSVKWLNEKYKRDASGIANILLSVEFAKHALSGRERTKLLSFSKEMLDYAIKSGKRRDNV